MCATDRTSEHFSLPTAVHQVPKTATAREFFSEDRALDFQNSYTMAEVSHTTPPQQTTTDMEPTIDNPLHKGTRLTNNFILCYPTSLPLADVICTPSQTMSNRTVFNFLYKGPMKNIGIRFLVDHPIFTIHDYSDAKNPNNIVLLLDIQAMIDSQDKLQSAEGSQILTLIRQLMQMLERKCQEAFPEFVFDRTKILSSAGNLSITLDNYRKTKNESLVDAYNELENSNLSMCIKIGYGWMLPQEEEDPTRHMHRIGIKLYVVNPSYIETSLPEKSSKRDTTITTLPKTLIKRKNLSITNRPIKRQATEDNEDGKSENTLWSLYQKENAAPGVLTQVHPPNPHVFCHHLPGGCQVALPIEPSEEDLEAASHS